MNWSQIANPRPVGGILGWRSLGVVAACALAAVAGCSGSHARTAGPLSGQSPSPTTTSTSWAHATPSPIIDDIGFYQSANAESDGLFVSPSGNIRCVFRSANDFAEVDCVINVRRWAAPACPPDELAAVSVGATKQDHTAARCESRPDALSVRALPYGHALRDMQVTCVSRATDISCSNGFHGFTVSRERLKTF